MSIYDLPGLNAFLNGLSTLLLLTGYRFVRRKEIALHQRTMTAALVSSSLFLASYLTYHAQVGSVRFLGTGPARTVYFTILISHTILAAAVAPMAVTVFVLARRKRFQAHRRLARVTLPIWLYVSVTGIVIYVMLYHLYPHG